MLRWPDRAQVDVAVREWAAVEAARRPELLRLGYFGSYAHGNWGVGSDLDLVAVVRRDDQPFERRAVAWDLSPLPVPTEILVYTAVEWQALQEGGGRFARSLGEAVWCYPVA